MVILEAEVSGGAVVVLDGVILTGVSNILPTSCRYIRVDETKAEHSELHKDMIFCKAVLLDCTRLYWCP